MKKSIIVILSCLTFVNCGSDGGNTVIKPPVENKKPVAVNDLVSGVEDTELIIGSLLNNDTVITGSKITSIDATSTENGNIIDNRNGTFSYNPPAGFVGQDTFKYTLCDNDATPDCSTATVTVTINDEGTPTAENDSKNTAKNTTITIDDYLDNDDVLDDAIIISVDDSGTSGTVVLNQNGTISYTPPTDFLGDDSFGYVLCDDDTPEPTCTTAIITVTVLDGIAFNIPSNLSSYYSDLSVTTDADLNYDFISDHTSDNHTTILSYGERHGFLYDADEDETNAANVILMYTSESRDEREYTSGNNSHSPQTFNTEHVYPQSKLESDGGVTDLHHLRSCDATINSDRSNYSFVSGNGTYQLINGNTWYPGDEWRGDVARMIMYLNVRYGETFEKVGTIDLFLEWNAADPVSVFELQRNAIIQGAQGVRNPFIDNPYLATLIWGGAPAENKWQ